MTMNLLRHTSSPSASLYYGSTGSSYRRDSHSEHPQIATWIRTIWWPGSASPSFRPSLPDLTPSLGTSSRNADVGEHLWSRIVDYSNLPDDWDGYGGKAANLATVMDTLEFLRGYSSTLPKPKPMMAGSGVIGLYWEGNGCYASIDFDGSGFYCYIADRPGDEGGEDRVSISSPLPQRLIEVIAETLATV